MKRRKLTIKTLINIRNELCYIYDVKLEDLISKSRERKYVYKRYLIASNLYIYLNASTVEIGKLLNRTHASILYGFKMIDYILVWEDELKEYYNKGQEFCKDKAEGYNLKIKKNHFGQKRTSRLFKEVNMFKPIKEEYKHARRKL